MKKVAILYGSSAGHTESVAIKIKNTIGVNVAVIFNVSDFPVSVLKEYNNLILGISTWGIGELQDDWEEFLPELARADLEGKIIALFGLGDAESYPDSFVDGMGAIYTDIKDKGCTIVGQVDAADYSFEASKAVYEGRFIGLPLDEENESDLTESRLGKWLTEITAQFI